MVQDNCLPYCTHRLKPTTGKLFCKLSLKLSKNCALKISSCVRRPFDVCVPVRFSGCNANKKKTTTGIRFETNETKYRRFFLLTLRICDEKFFYSRISFAARKCSTSVSHQTKCLCSQYAQRTPKHVSSTECTEWAIFIFMLKMKTTPYTF